MKVVQNLLIERAFIGVFSVHTIDVSELWVALIADRQTVQLAAEARSIAG